MTKKLLLYVVNNPAFFLSHRLALAVAARDEGFDVHVATMGGAAVAKIEQFGFTHHKIRLSRSGRNPLQEMSSLISIWRLIRNLRPQLVHLVTIKPVLYGGIAARMLRVPAVVSAVSGLGFLFVARSGWRLGLIRSLVLLIYRFAMRHPNQQVIFQNPNDKSTLIRTIGLRESKTTLIRGSGVDLDVYQVTPEPEKPVIVVMASRLLKDKGVYEFVDAARILKSRQVNVCFQLVGEIDPGNPESVNPEAIREWRQEGIVGCLDFRDDIPEILARAHIVALPSFYGEGLPKILVEAAACGRAVVTTDMPGCRDAIEPDRSGLLIPARNAVALADAIQRLTDDDELRRQMGVRGRQLAERDYSIGEISRAHIDIYRSLLRTS